MEGSEAHTGVHTPLTDQTVELQVAETRPENPELQTGVHTVPLKLFAAQFPGPPLVTVG
jgi:hypothetical protein